MRKDYSVTLEKVAEVKEEVNLFEFVRSWDIFLHSIGFNYSSQELCDIINLIKSFQFYDVGKDGFQYCSFSLREIFCCTTNNHDNFRSLRNRLELYLDKKVMTDINFHLLNQELEKALRILINQMKDRNKYLEYITPDVLKEFEQ